MLSQLIDHEIFNKRVQLRQKKCLNNHPIDKLCIGHKCTKHTSHCSHAECSLFEKHLYCPKIQTKAFSRLMEEQAQTSKELILGLHGIEKGKFQELKETWLSFIKQIEFYDITSEDRTVFDRIFTQERKKVKGQQAQQLFRSWIAKKQKRQRLVPLLLTSFSEELEKITQSINSLRHRVYREFLSLDCREPDNVDDKSQHPSEPVSSQQLATDIYRLDSLVLQNNDKEYHQKMAFISQALGKPRNFKLIYRGSESNFSSAEFHRHCDDVPHTLTLVKTSFGKTIAGYTPLAWKSSPETEYFTDESMRSCLLQVDSHLKLVLTDKSTAIGCNSKTGPLFGSGHDLALYDRCNTNNYSYANYPRSYSCNPQSHQLQNFSIEIFSGARKSSNFTVEQYEVFRVIFEDD